MERALVPAGSDFVDSKAMLSHGEYQWPKFGHVVQL
jgi:hypothetical protein